jgi:HD-GYP domain-containing protein (c-di-GMP phosphodiesterase class II)
LNNMINKVEKNYSSADEKLKAVNEVFVTTKEIVQSVGLPPRVIEVCESVMESISSDVLKGKDKFASYLTQMKDHSKVNFQFRFVELTSFIATQMVEVQNEPGKNEQIKKIVFAAFFCDISLTESEHLNYRSEESIKDLWPEDKKTILEHALKSSQIAAKYKNAPEDADVIIKQHHGSVDGTGFKDATGPIHPLAKCLMAAQELAFCILKETDKSPETVINNVLTRFQGTPIHSYLVLFEKSCKRNL